MHAGVCAGDRVLLNRCMTGKRLQGFSEPWGGQELSDCIGETLCFLGDVVCLQGMCGRGAYRGQLALAGLLRGPAHGVGGCVQAMGLQHLQQQVVQGHHVLALHVVQMFHTFVTTEDTERTTLDPTQSQNSMNF